MEWINVKDRLPNPHKQHVLVVLSNKTVHFATDWVDWPDGHVTFWIPFYERWFDVTHWMPLPEPPKGD